MCIVVKVSSFSSSNKVDLGFGVFFLLSLFLSSGWDGEMGRGPCAQIWVSLPSSGALLGGGVLPRRSCSCSVTPVLRRPAFAAHAGRLGHGGRDGFVPVCGTCCYHIHLGLHHRRLDPAASTDLWNRCLQPAAAVGCIGKAFQYYEFNCMVWLIDFQKMVLLYTAEAKGSTDVLTVCILLDASMVLQASPAREGEGRYWYQHLSTFFCSIPDVACYSICGVLAEAPGMDMMLDPLISKNGYMHNSLEIFESGYWSIVVAEFCMYWDNLECVCRWNQIDKHIIYLMSTSVHTQQGRICSSTTDTFIMASTIATHERLFLRGFSCTCYSLSYDHYVQDAVPLLFGLCHRRWTTTPPSLIPRFNGRDTWSLSSVKLIRYLQLNPTPRVHIPDRPLGKPPTGHQLDRSYIEALEDCKCGNFGFGLSTDGRTPYGFICNLLHLFHKFRSCCVQLGTHISCSTVESHVTMYYGL